MVLYIFLSVWEMVVAIFYAETGKHLEREKARKLFQRMRTQENKV